MFRYRENTALYRKVMRCLYQKFESKSVRDLYQRAMSALWMNNGIVKLLQVPQESMNVIQNLLCYFLFGTVISFVSPWLVVLLTALPMVNWFCVRAYNRYEYGTREARADLEKKLFYTSRRGSDFATAKDVRVYGMTGWLRAVYRDLTNQLLGWQKRLSGRELLTQLVDLGVILVRDGAAYYVLIRMAVRGELSADQFVLYFAAISSFATFIGNIMTALGKVQEASLKTSDFREYMDLPEGDDAGTERADAHLNHAPEILFDHVSFRYEGAERDTLHDLSFTFHPGERIALVGMNGAGKTTLEKRDDNEYYIEFCDVTFKYPNTDAYALRHVNLRFRVGEKLAVVGMNGSGKTTFIKLLCRLYDPTEGEIRLNGVDIRKYDYDEYMAIFSVVFQDFQLFAYSLGQSVAASAEYDAKRAEACLREAGFEERLSSMPKGLDTSLYQDFDKNGIEISGGEAQKIAIARALYKNAPFIVLDEPTAALDPVSEYEVYRRFGEISGGKTAIYISHRLASCRFCDEILVFHEGQIVQHGAHEALLAQENGKYAELWNAQAQYYTETA